MSAWTLRMVMGTVLLVASGSGLPAMAQDCIDERIDDQRGVVIELIDVLDKQADIVEQDVSVLRRLVRRSKSRQASVAMRAAQLHLDDLLQAVDAAEDELAELDAMSHTRHEINDSDVGHRRGGPDPCVVQCPETGSCQALDELNDFDTVVDDAVRRLPPGTCDNMFPFLVTGTCSDGTQFVYEGGGFTAGVQYFDAAGAFVARTFVNDVPLEFCGTTTYWPEHIDCSGAVVGSVYCGKIFEVGEEVCMP